MSVWIRYNLFQVPIISDSAAIILQKWRFLAWSLKWMYRNTNFWTTCDGTTVTFTIFWIHGTTTMHVLNSQLSKNYNMYLAHTGLQYTIALFRLPWSITYVIQTCCQFLWLYSINDRWMNTENWWNDTNRRKLNY